MIVYTTNNKQLFLYQAESCLYRANSVLEHRIQRWLMHKILHIMQLYANIPTFSHATDMMT